MNSYLQLQLALDRARELHERSNAWRPAVGPEGTRPERGASATRGRAALRRVLRRAPAPSGVPAAQRRDRPASAA